MSIKPEYAEKIFSGEKHFEYRKRKCSKSVTSMIIYETSPVKKVVGEASILKILQDTPSKIWKLTSTFSGVSEDFFYEYFNNCDLATAYALGNIERFSCPKDLSCYGISKAPQSYIYI